VGEGLKHPLRCSGGFEEGFLKVKFYHDSLSGH